MIYCPTITTVLNNNSISHPKMGLYDPLQDQESWQLIALRGAFLLGLPMSGARPHPSVRGSPRSASCQRGGQRRAIPAPPQFQAELPRPVLHVTAEPACATRLVPLHSPASSHFPLGVGPTALPDRAPAQETSWLPLPGTPA